MLRCQPWQYCRKAKKTGEKAPDRAAELRVQIGAVWLALDGHDTLLITGGSGMDFRQELIQAGQRLLSEGLTVETWGNLSLRDRETGLVYITPSGMDYTHIQPEDIVVLRPDGSVAEGTRKPSVEAGLHLAVYARRPEIGAIVHSHPKASMVFACTGEEIPVITDEAAQALGGPVPVCGYALPGTPELAAACARTLETGMACLLRSHGAVCLGKDMAAAFKTAKVLELTAELYWRIRAMGARPETIPRELVDRMWDFAQNHYGQEK